MNRFFLLSILCVSFFISADVFGQKPTFSSAKTLSLTSIEITFSQGITAVAKANGSDFTSANFTATAATISSGRVILTVNTLSGSGFTTNDLAIAADAVTGTSSPPNDKNNAISGAIVTDGIAPSGYAVSIDQPFINNANKSAISFTFAGAEVGTTYNYSIDDASLPGTTPITGSGTVAAANSQITGIDVSSLGETNLTLTVYLTDAALNQGSNATSVKLKDTIAPQISIGAPSAAFATSSSSRTYTISYTDANSISSISLANGDITVNPAGGGNASANVTGSGIATRTVTLTGFTGNGGSVTISIAAGTATDQAGNTAAGAGPSAGITIDTDAPTVVLSSDDANAIVRDANTVIITATFTESASGISGTPTISIPTASAPVTSAAMTGGPLIWTYSWNVPSGNQTVNVTISAIDNAGNANSAPTGVTSYIIDNLPPSAVTINQAVGQDDPAYASTANFTIVFTNGPIDPVTFTGGDFTIGGSATYTIGTPTTSDNITWNAVATVTTSGTVIPTTNTNRVSDLAGNVGGSNTSTSTDGSVEVIVEPTTPATSITASAVTSNTLTITRAGGNGNRYLLVAREGAPVNFVPVDGTDYGTLENLNFYSAVAVDVNGNKILGDAPSSTTTYNISELEGGKTYHFAIYAYNRGSAAPRHNYNTTATTTSQLTTACVNPTAPTTLTTASNTTSVTLGWTRAVNTDLSLVLFRVDDGSPITAPINGVDFSSIDNAAFGSAGTFGNAKVVLADETSTNGLTQSRTITGLSPGVTYAFAIYTYNPTTFCYQPTNLTGTKATTTTTDPELTISAGVLTEPATISSMSTALSGAIAPQTNAVANFDFIITDAQGNDDNSGSDGANGLITQIVINPGSNNQITDWSQAIASARISDGTNSQTTTNIGTNTITFASIPTGSGALGRILDDQSKTYTLTIVFKTTLLGSLPTTIDGLQFDFNVTTASILATGTGSTMAAAQTLSSGASKNVVNVTASRVNFTSIPPNATQAGIPFSISISATDANGNLDLSENGTGSTMRLGGVYSGTGGVLTFSTSQDVDLTAGIGTWTGLKVNKGGDWYFTIDDQDTAPIDLTPSLAQSSTVTFAPASPESTLDVNALFSYPSNIDYRSHQRVLTTPGAPGTDVIKVAEFIINDGGADLTDTDQIGTILTGITFSVTNPGNLRLLGLYDGSTIVAYQTAGATTIFSGLNILAEDIANSGTGQKTIALYASFKTNVSDNENFSFQVTNVATANGGSTFAQPNGGGALTLNGPLINNVIVNATELRFPQNTSDTYLYNTMTPTVTVETTDNLGSRDTDITTPGGPGGAVNISSSLGTMTPSLVLAPITNGFGAVASNIVHTVTGTGLTLNAFLGQTPSIIGSSQNFAILADNKSDIIFEGGSSPTNIFYANHQDATITSSLSTGNVQVAQFRLQDGGSTHIDLDAAPTVLNNITFNITGSTHLKRVAIFNGTTLLAERAAAASVNFSGFSLSTISDGLDALLTVRVSFNSTVTDNAQIGFQVAAAATTTSSSLFASGNAGGASSPSSPNNLIEVVASKYFFTTPVQGSSSNSVLAKVALTTAPASGGLGSNVRLEARDANNNLDLDHANAVTVTNAGNLPMTDGAVNTSPVATISNYSFSAGVLQFPSGFRYESTGNGTLRINGAISITDLTAPPSPPITVSSSSTSDIVEDLSGTFTSYNQNIEYLKYPASSTDISPSNPSNPNPSTDNEIKVAQFKIRDGGASNDLDNADTELNGITFTITNYQFINRLALYDGNTELGEVLLGGASATATFNSISAIAGDNGSKILSLFATFTNTITDNTKISFQITNASANTLKSTFATANAGGAATANDISNNDNRIEVVASKIDFTTIPASASISVPISVKVSALDANNNLDADYNGTITSTSNTIPASFTTANDPTGAFIAGVKDYPSNFQFTSGNGDVRLTITAGAGSGANNVNAGALNGPNQSPIINVISSFDSWLYFDPSFSYTTRIDFANKQEDPIVSTSHPLARLILSDGGSAYSTQTTSPNTDNLTPGVKNQTLHKDADGSFTKIDNFTISLTNFQNIRKIALYASDGTTKIGSDITPTLQGTVTFTGLSTYAAPDDGIYSFYIRASFNSVVTDLSQIGMQITAVTHDSGSKFAEQKPVLPPASVAGVDGAGTFGDSSPLTNGSVAVNVLDVITTKFDFIQSPPRYAGINEPVPLAGTPIIKVEARDKFDNLDTEFNFSTSSSLYGVSVTAATAGVNSGGGTFANGVLTLPSLRYTTPGNGKLTVTSTNNTSITSNVVGAIQCSAVDVIHVTAVENRSNGVSLLESLKGGTTNNRIFGFTFQAPHVDAANSEPLLEGFTITFKDKNGNPYPYATTSTTIFKNFKIFKSINGAAPTPTTGELTIAEVDSEQLHNNNPSTTSKDMVKVTFINKPTLYDGKSYTFYLSVDVDVSVSVGTPAITPYLQDQGNGFPLTNNHILISNGSTEANLIGITRGFASTKPPVLTKTTPNNGTLNVRKDLDYVEVHFDVPVVTFDGVAYLFKRDNPTDTVAVLTASNGLFIDSNTLPAADAIKTQVVDSIRFLLPLNFPDLEADEVYFITLPKGRFSTIDRNDRAGISDEGLNLFGGISFNGTFYFKVGSDLAPILLSSNRDKYFYTPTTATFNTSFDQAGKAYYMVVKSSGGTPPTVTNDQILGNVAIAQETDVIKRDFYLISQVSPNYQYTTINSNLMPDTDYWVYLFAENDRDPTPARHVKPYGGFIDDGASNNDYVVGGNGPTLVLKKPSSPPVTRYNNPSFTICTNSSIKLQEPIIISEIASNDFQRTGVQTFNLLLPSGFQFDIKKDPVFTGNGSDFDPLPTGTKRFNYINSTFLEISFVNTGAISTDNIIISDIYVIASEPDLSGKIKRFAGTGLSVVESPTDLATISSIPASAITFTNTYSDANNFDLTPLFIANTVTYIPDNYVDANGTSTIRLIPVIAPGVRDFGSSSFSGSGLTNDILTLSAVSLNSAFNITITHTDQNGCISNSSEQYAVYDHTAAIPELLPDPDDDKDIRIAISNINFPNNPPSLKDPSQKVSYEGLAGFKLLDLYANVPSRATAISDTTNFAANALTDQIIFGANWKNLIKYIPVPIASVLSDNLSSPGNDVFYKTYNWDYTSILHNDSLAKYSVANPYFTFFERTTLDRKTTSGATIPGQKYYTGGSLGLVEFTGKYQSTADFSVFVPYRQEVELFVPAVPVIEVSGESSFQGSTPVFCESTSGNILISGYPAASSTSKGSFTLYDSANYNPNNPNNPAAIIYKVGLNPKKEPSGFIDNANGTANLNVGQIFNSYRTIRIEYTYQDNNSPAIGKGVTYIRVTPNPVAKFSTSNLCEDISINFTDESFFVPANGIRIAKWDWNFNDINASGTNPNRETIQNPIHRYSEPLDYPNVSLIVTTNFGCASPVNQETLSIGGTPAVAFSLSGVSTADPITFKNESTIVNDVTKKLEWTFGDGKTQSIISGFSSAVINNYANAGAYTANLKVTSTKGCYNSLSKSVIILPRVTSTIANPYVATFEDDNGGWQHAPNDTTINKLDSWAHGMVNKTLTKSTIDGTKAWATSLTGTFSANERSALYSPSFDIRGLARPMVSFDKFVQFNRNEGVIIEYSVDNLNVADENKKWQVLGEDIDEGVEWFNGQAIASKPGKQLTNDFGWYDSEITEWREAKHTISNVSGKDPIEDAIRVVFRFALAARTFAPTPNFPVLTVDNEGFAIDNFRIGERTRIILHESFANTGNSSAEEKSENDFIRGFKTVGTDVVRINYHTGFPGADPFNLDNPADNSSRALFYNVKSTPESYLDGEYGGIPLIKEKFSVWGEKSFAKQTLSLANANIKVNQTIDGNGIKINVDVTAIDATIPKDSVALFIAILEESIPLSSLSSTQKTKVASGETEFNYVLKKMLPSASGTVLNSDIPKGITKNFGRLDNASQDKTFTWLPDPTKFYTPNTSNLAIVAFLQNVVTKKIYQSSIIMDLNDPDTDLVTGIESILPEQVNIYPNPASSEFRVELPAMVQNETNLHLIDITGRKYERGVIPSGSNSTTVNVEDLSEGIYILEIGSGSTGIIRKKIMVVMKN